MQESTPQSDPAVPTADQLMQARHREKVARTLEAGLERIRHREPAEVESMELLLRDARRMARVHLARAGTPEAQEQISDEIWKHFVQLYGAPKGIRYDEFNDAIWHEGLAEIAEGIAEPALKATASKGGRPRGLPVDREELIKLRAGRTRSLFAQLIRISADKLARAEKDGHASADTLRAINRYRQQNTPKKDLQKPQ